MVAVRHPTRRASRWRRRPAGRAGSGGGGSAEGACDGGGGVGGEDEPLVVAVGGEGGEDEGGVGGEHRFGRADRVGPAVALGLALVRRDGEAAIGQVLFGQPLGEVGGFLLHRGQHLRGAVIAQAQVGAEVGGGVPQPVEQRARVLRELGEDGVLVPDGDGQGEREPGAAGQIGVGVPGPGGGAGVKRH